MSNKILVQGTCDHKFTPLYEAMEENLNDPEKYLGQHHEYGANVAVYLENEPVVDLWGGHCDPVRKQPWTSNTIHNMGSVGKPLCVLPLLMLAERGMIDLEDPVVKYWPEYGQNGKEDTKVWMTLCMQTGVTELPLKTGDAFLTYKMIRAYEEASATHGVGTPAWGLYYHSIPGPHLVTRLTGRSVGQFWEQEIARPFRIDYHFGLSSADRKRFAKLIFVDGNPSQAAVQDPQSPWHASTRGCPYTDEYINSDRFLGSELYAVNGCGSARGIAKYYSILANGGEFEGRRLISQEMLEYARKEAWAGETYLNLPWRLTKGGYELSDVKRGIYFDDNPNTFGSAGFPECRGFANPDAKLGFCWSHNMFTVGSKPSKYYQRIREALIACM
jgi:CubicO group peptidase (beta-lactamase class C family)